MDTKRRNTRIRGWIGILPLFLAMTIGGCGGNWTGGIGRGGGGKASRLKIDSCVPADKSESVDLGTSLRLEFSKDPHPDEVAKKITLRVKNGKKVAVQVIVEEDIVTVTPIDPLKPGKKYVLAVGKIKPHVGGRRMKRTAKFRFTTVSPAAVAAGGTDPAGEDVRTGHTATLLLSGKVFIAGGFLSGEPTATTRIYDPVEDTTVAGPPLPMARAYHTAILLPDGRVRISGGRVGPDLVPAVSDWIFDPAAGSIPAPGR